MSVFSNSSLSGRKVSAAIRALAHSGEKRQLANRGSGPWCEEWPGRDFPTHLFFLSEDTDKLSCPHPRKVASYLMQPPSSIH